MDGDHGFGGSSLKFDWARFAALLLPRRLVEIDHDPMIEYQTQRLEYLSE